MADYAKSRGRSFGTYMDRLMVDRLMVPLTELVQDLKNPSAFINITRDDITRLNQQI